MLEKLMCKESMSYKNQCNGKMSRNSKFDFFFFFFFFFFMNSFHKIDSFKQVVKLYNLLLFLRVFSSTFDLLNTNKIQVKCLSVDFKFIPLHLL